jgi:phosphosulfolactate synthase (CoM biosynthesis protein A)
METVASLGFDVLEVSAGFISLPLRDWQRLLEDAHEAGLTVRG